METFGAPSVGGEQGGKGGMLNDGEQDQINIQVSCLKIIGLRGVAGGLCSLSPVGTPTQT